MSVFILASHRSGSSLLCKYLESTGVCGNPEEFFMHYQGVSYQNWDIQNYEAYIERVVAETQTPNRVFSAKLMTGWDGAYGILKRLYPTFQGSYTVKMKELSKFFPNLRCIYLSRRNKVAQAVSWHKAGQSNIYHRIKNQSVEFEYQYDFQALQDLITSLIMEEAAHQEFLDSMQISPLSLVYEDMVQDMPGTIRKILNFLEISEKYSIIHPNLKKMSDELSQTWISRYRQEAQSSTPDRFKRW